MGCRGGLPGGPSQLAGAVAGGQRARVTQLSRWLLASLKRSFLKLPMTLLIV